MNMEIFQQYENDQIFVSLFESIPCVTSRIELVHLMMTLLFAPLLIRWASNLSKDIVYGLFKIVLHF